MRISGLILRVISLALFVGAIGFEFMDENLSFYDWLTQGGFPMVSIPTRVRVKEILQEL